MTEKGVGAAVVLDEEQPGPGVVSERDMLNSLGRGEDPDVERVGDHMSDTVISAAPDWSLERAAVEMSRRHIRHLVVVEAGELIGVLSMRDIVRVWTSDGATASMTRQKPSRSRRAPSRAVPARSRSRWVGEGVLHVRTDMRWFRAHPPTERHRPATSAAGGRRYSPRFERAASARPGSPRSRSAACGAGG